VGRVRLYSILKFPLKTPPFVTNTLKSRKILLLYRINRTVDAMTKLTAIDLFSGCGGLSLGLKKAGFKVLAAVELDELAAETYSKNLRKTHVLRTDIRRISPSALMKLCGLKQGELDLLAGCPPCQGFSTLRTLNGHTDIDEPMNDLVFQFRRFARALLPKTIMMENVPGLAKDARLKQFCRSLRKLGYSMKFDVLDAADFGVPQRRRRMILIASRLGDVEFAPKLRRPTTVRDAIGGLVTPGNADDPLHVRGPKRTDKIEALIRKIPRNGGSRTSLRARDQLPCHRKTDGFKDIYGRMAWDRPAPTITGGCINPSKGRFLHPVAHRAITLREAALLQGFPARYRFPLSSGAYAVAQLIGNAFPPAFAACHARKLARKIQSRDSSKRKKSV
jgi:DNA (cytosine-5)-methyltransferase 1